MVDSHIRLPLGDVHIKELWARDLPMNLEPKFSVQAGTTELRTNVFAVRLFALFAARTANNDFF